MTDSGSPGPETTRPEPVLHAIPLQAVPSPTAPSPAVPSQAALFRERRGPVDNDEGPLLSDASELRAGWQRIKAGFVDNPRSSVAEAATVVEEATEMLVAALRARQGRIRDTWDGDGPSRDTEALRQALLTYQSFFNRITGR